MMEDLFEKEQKVLEDAENHVHEIESGATYNISCFLRIVREYGRLLRQLRRIVKISDKTAVELNESKLALLNKVHYDGLTGIYNRRFMEENLSRVIKSTSRIDGALSVLMVDIDFFKGYNDIYGHGEGDKCLKIVAETLRNSIMRADDFVARYGGEEFAVILPMTDECGARSVANRILSNVRAREIPHKKSDVADYVTISIGAATGNTKNMQSSEDYINKADKALYISKQTGRNKYTFLNLDVSEDGKQM